MLTMTSLTEETVYTSLYYPQVSMNSHSPTDPTCGTPICHRPPENASETPWGSLKASLTAPVLNYTLFITNIYNYLITVNY